MGIHIKNERWITIVVVFNYDKFSQMCQAQQERIPPPEKLNIVTRKNHHFYLEASFQAKQFYAPNRKSAPASD